MSYIYFDGSVRAKRFRGRGDVRSYRAPKGWRASADLIDVHPATGHSLSTSQWWIFETYEGDL